MTDSEAEITSPLFKREPTTMEREKTTVSIADFYAPTPDINKSCTLFIFYTFIFIVMF
jgi:hypothetical protein